MKHILRSIFSLWGSIPKMYQEGLLVLLAILLLLSIAVDIEAVVFR